MCIQYTKLLQLQDPPKFTQNGIFGLKIKPSGNPFPEEVSFSIENSFV
jgi:hypothetical protein